jgi:hypothetical protein
VRRLQQKPVALCRVAWRFVPHITIFIIRTPTAAGSDIDDVQVWMSDPGPMPALSNGDLAPQNLSP